MTTKPPHQPDELLRFENVCAGYGKRRILSDLNFTISTGDYVAFVGSNGSGKTTLLRTLLGLLCPQSGVITTDTDPRLHFGYVPQLQAVDEIFPISVFDVVLMGRYGRLGAFRRPRAEDKDKAMASLKEVGIEHMAPRLFRELSGGQKQRTLIARALCNDPNILVLDEHTNDLDIVSGKAIMEIINRLHTERHLAVVMVTHSLNTVANHALKIGLIRDGSLVMEPAENVMKTEYLQKLYGMDIQVIEMDGRRVVI